MANLAITLGDVLVNAKGGKFCPLKDAEGRPPTWTSDWLRIIWHPSAYGEPEARRVNLCVEPDDAAREHFEAVERKLAQELSSKSIHDDHFRLADFSFNFRKLICRAFGEACKAHLNDLFH